MKSRVIILVNTGTPDTPDRSSVRKYLSEFLNDPRVIDMPWLLRKLLVNVIIVPFRAGRSSRLYHRLWTEEGSPLLVNLEKLAAAVRIHAGETYSVLTAMRYGNPSLRQTIRNLEKSQVRELVVLPLYPQYASSTSGSVAELVMKEVSAWNTVPQVRIAGQFFDHPRFIEAFAGNIRKYDPSKYDHVLFSYHSLPLKHLAAIHPGQDQGTCSCNAGMPEHGSMCYRAACYETTRLIAGKLGLTPETYSSAFQSRFARNWLGPFTDQVIRELAKEGKKRILFIAPSFVADCLETIVEAEDYRKMFRKAGGEELVLVESLNGSDEWARAVTDILKIR